MKYKLKLVPRVLALITLAAALTIIAANIWLGLNHRPAEINRGLSFNSSLTVDEQALIRQKLGSQNPKLSLDDTTAAAVTGLSATPHLPLLAIYVPVTGLYNVKQSVTTIELRSYPKIYVPEMDKVITQALAAAIGVEPGRLVQVADMTMQLNQHPDSVGLVSIENLNPSIKLLRLNNHYYLDSFNVGAIFRQVYFSDSKTSPLGDANLGSFPDREQTLKINMSGVTAITRVLMQKIIASGDWSYPAKNIGVFLADADYTHTSNEVSFREGCGFSFTSFCAQPASVKTLKASGIDIVELTGNHNNDAGMTANITTVKLYHSLGWGTFGGGLNAAEAARAYIVNKKNTVVTFLGYNYYDTVNRTGAIAGLATPGANSFNFAKIKKDISAAKAQGAFVIVDIQYQECYSYPDSYQIYPFCYRPLKMPDQKADFEKIIDLGADMVIGTQAHQPQTYEIYKQKPIYFGLGNLYFDQTRWPGTEQGMILTHYFENGKLLQTKLSPTVYDQKMQPRLMNNSEVADFLSLLNQAR